TKVQVFALKFGGGGLKVDEYCLEEYTTAVGECILIHNEGFEDGLNNWQIAGGTVSNTVDAYSGASAVKIVSNGARFFQRLAVEVGKTYQLTAWAKIYGQPTYAELSLEWKDINNNTISSVLQPILFWDTEYRLFTLKGKAPAGAIYAEVGGYKEGGSSHLLFADDFCFSLTDPLGGTNYNMVCGCSDNMVPNGGFEESDVTSFPVTFGGIPAYAISPWDPDIVKPWYPSISSKYAFYLNDIYDQVNNPEGDRFVWLPNNGDCWIADMDFSNNLKLEDGQTYRFCFYAATWAEHLDNDGFPDGGPATQHPGILNLEFSFVSGFKPVFAWAVPTSESFNNLSWEKLEYTFTYNIQDPISNFVFTNARSGVGMAIDGVTLSKVVCPPIVECGTGGISFERWGNVSGTKTYDLTTSKNYPNNYDEAGTLTSFQGPDDFDDNYGTRVYGYLIPPETGNYQFNLTCDDSGELFLSSDETFANKSSIASVSGKTGVTEHTKYPEQTSASISLDAGTKYYIELLHKDGSGGDHFQVYWKTPSNSSWVIIPGSALSPICHPEICYNNIDDDFDGLTDCEDDECGPILVGNYFITDENCGSGGGAIDISPLAADLPLSYQWSDMPEKAWWTFEESPNDVSGNVNHPNGIAGYPIYSTDAVQGRFSAYFNGDTYIRYSVDNGFMEKEFKKLTVAMWIKPSNLVGIKTLFDEGGSTGGKGLAIRLTNNVITAGVKNGGTLFSDASHVLTDDGLWHHVAAVFDKGKFTVYLDGVPGPTITTNFEKVKKHGNNGGIGAPISGSVLNSGNTRYVGLMDDVRYYHNKALTPNQIADLANNTGDRSNLSAGSYSITLSSASGCTTTATMNIASSSNFTNGGTIDGDEIQCATTYDGSVITSVTLPSGGGNGPTEYQWEMSTDGGNNWTVIDSAANASYDPPVISNETMYRRGSRLSPCLDWVYSNAVTKSFTVNFNSAGIISGNESSCGAFDPSPIASISAPSGGGSGSTEYEWQKSTDGGFTWTTIAGATLATYDPPTITQITQYRRGARRHPCNEFLYTNAVQKTVVTPLTGPGTIVGEESQCGSFDPEVISSISAA
ncbi:MAG: LamG-like jellyroll fold domain-containing protein, partial [Saprospiraceae bacterium]